VRRVDGNDTGRRVPPPEKLVAGIAHSSTMYPRPRISSRPVGVCFARERCVRILHDDTTAAACFQRL
jgi:hypothetical protein